MTRLRRGIAQLALLLTLSLLAAADDSPIGKDRTYDFPITAVQAALRQMGAYTGARLPTLDGFITMAKAEMPHYTRPYYEYKIDLEAKGSAQTVVHVKANVSAWCEDAESGQSSYQAFASSGRLESDLLDRLADYLVNNKSSLVADPRVLETHIAEVRQQETEAQGRIAELEKQLQAPDPAANGAAGPEFVAVGRPRALVLSAPQEKAEVRLRAQQDDEFEVLEHRGRWLKVKLDDAADGWLDASQVKPDRPPAENASGNSTTAAAPAGYTVVRENISNFSGDWAPLVGKTALYVWARPVGSSLNVSPAAKLKFIESLFSERGRVATHNSQNKLAGLVVIFLDQEGGVAAASISDIRRWLDGDLSNAAFLRKCSLDPPSQFTLARSRSVSR
ncbi:MAG TPA: hypothetical protein VMH85_21370 [Terriglobales bacterium]|nr:hypothetical protein [Terriglobales bacterium]